MNVSAQVFGRTLAVLGLGRIGSEVAARLQAFGMRVIGYDPMITKEQAAAKNIELLSLDEIWPQADFITVHVPLIPATENLINAKTLAKCKKGVKIINVARGGIVNEQDLVDALNSGQAGGAAFDVFVEHSDIRRGISGRIKLRDVIRMFVKEPPKYRGLVEHPKAICTPHLGASTIDAQLRVATEIAENIVQLNNGNLLGVLNAKQVL
ncbi:hypothetical protein Y032_0065g3579 [Ancylostoma ceylanicum]|uniref:D-3-phosphoglycerate dehydrogenase n=1 Tax=Ancylostoma ceylanicum TaxID=53326 RepID=A0A016U086_9BILA|nr:hypothetical protein Y032_0065g3579 [Ancylostoma ceylanicum]